MTTDEPPRAGAGECLLINSPIDSERLDALIAAATAAEPTSVIDHGCGWGEVLLRVLERVPEAAGVGVEVHEPDRVRAQALAEAHGLTDRVRFVAGSSAEHTDAADLLINLGAYHAFGDIAKALSELRDRCTPGGRLIFGAEYWIDPPTTDELSHMWSDASVDDCLSLAELVDAALAAGWRILDLHDSTRTEFDAYEVGHLRAREEWLLDHPSHPIRAELDRAWSSWLRGHRRPMGFLTLLLAVPARA